MKGEKKAPKKKNAKVKSKNSVQEKIWLFFKKRN